MKVLAWMLGWAAATAMGQEMAMRDVPLQRPEERQVTRQQSEEIYGVLQPLARGVSPSAVWVWSGGRQLAVGTVVGDGSRVLTKWSEIALARGGLQCVGGGGETATASVAGVYVDEDLALLELEGRNFTPVQWAPDENLPIGSFLVAVSPNDEPLNVGVVSVAARSLNEADQAYLGVAIDYEYDGEGVKLSAVEPETAADQAGLREGDLILEVGGESVRGAFALRNALKGYKPADRVALKLRRDGEDQEVEVELGERPELGGIPPGRLRAMRRMGGAVSRVGDGFPMAVQTDMQLKKEQCGGPVIDLQGKVVGLAIARTDRTRSFVIPSSEVARLLGNQPVDPSLAQLDAGSRPPGGAPQGEAPRMVPMDGRVAGDLRRHLEEMQALLDRIDREMNAIGER